jgi:serine O-acetyltransferase
MDLNKKLQTHLRHFNKDKYFKMFKYVTTNKGGCLLKRYWYYYRCKRMEGFNGASLGINLGWGTQFGSIPKLPHGIHGVIINPYSKIGKNCTIFHDVTIGNDYKDVKNAPTIGDNVLIGAGAKIIGKITIGNNVRIGAGAVVAIDIPDNATVVMENPRIIIKKA